MRISAYEISEYEEFCGFGRQKNIANSKFTLSAVEWANLIVQRSLLESLLAAFGVMSITFAASFYEYAKNRQADNKDNDGKNDIYENCTKTNRYSCENESSSGGGI